jgi:hypothetical protein
MRPTVVMSHITKILENTLVAKIKAQTVLFLTPYLTNWVLRRDFFPE